MNKGGNIVLSLTDNPAFPSPIPPLADVQDALSTYSAALVTAESLGRDNVSAKNQARAILELLLGQLGRYVMFVANGDENALVSSGFPLAKDPQPRTLVNPGNVTLENGISTGELISSVAKGNASGFVHQIADILPTEATVWTSHPSSSRKYVFKNLTPGKQYWVRVIAIGFRGQQAISNVSTLFAQ